jgi:cytosine/adenosine deaminase-related metal-dependent hydrolase
VLFDTTYPEWQPLFNPVSNLVYSATGNSVADVFVAGEQVVRDGHLTKVDEDEILKLVGDAMTRIGGRLNLRKLVKLRWPVV